MIFIWNPNLICKVFDKNLVFLIYRYGPLFKTTILGRHVVVTADPEANHFILQQEGKLVELSYLDAAALLFGHDDSSTHDSTGPVHKYIRMLIMNHFGYESLKKKLLNQVEALAHKSLLTWSTQPSSIDLNRTISLTIFDFISKELFSYDPTRFPESMGVAFIDFLECLASIPLNIPGTAFHRCLKVTLWISTPTLIMMIDVVSCES